MVRAAVRWAIQHGAARVVLNRAARAGDPQALLVTDERVRADPYALLDTVRERGPLVRGRLAHVTASHAVVRDVLRSEDFATGADTAALPPSVRAVLAWSRDARALGPIDPPSMLAVEPPDHTRYRRLVSKVFTVRAVQGLRPKIEQVANALLDDLPRDAPYDLVERYATMLPVIVIAELLGVPADERTTVLAYGNQVAPSLDLGLTWRQFRDVRAGLVGFNAWLDGHLARLRRSPGDDLLSQLVTLEDDGSRLSDVELRATAGLVLGAGFETTVNLLGSGAVLLAAHPDQLALLRADPALWGNAVEEVLRYESPVQVTARAAVRDTHVAGVPLRRGTLVVTLLSGANRDPAVFPDPHRFDVTRPNARDHLAFSGGRHFCLGAALARLEGEVGLQVLHDRLPGLRLLPGARRRPTRVLRGWERLPATA